MVTFINACNTQKLETEITFMASKLCDCETKIPTIEKAILRTAINQK